VSSGRNHKVLRLPAIQIRALLGKGGQTINEIRNRSGADIKIHHPPQDEFGSVSIVGNIDLVENLVSDALAMKGCPILPSMLGAGSDPLNVAEDEVLMPQHLVGLFIGARGEGVKEIKARVTGNVFISVQPPVQPGGPQRVQIAGSGRKEAAALIRGKVEELRNRQMVPGQLAPFTGVPGSATVAAAPVYNSKAIKGGGL